LELIRLCGQNNDGLRQANGTAMRVGTIRWRLRGTENDHPAASCPAICNSDEGRIPPKYTNPRMIQTHRGLHCQPRKAQLLSLKLRVSR
jgi:hypothetical protein